MDEIVSYDFPAIFHTIREATGRKEKIIYIGHSLGTSLALMYGAEFPTDAKNNLKLLILLSPAYSLGNMISPYKMAAPYGDWIVVSMNRISI